MSKKNVNFRDRKIFKNGFYRNKKVTRIDDIDANKILVSKEESYDIKIHLNTLSDTMIMMLLESYA